MLYLILSLDRINNNFWIKQLPIERLLINNSYHIHSFHYFSKSGKALPPGSFSITPTGVNHFAYTDNDEVIILLHGMGPVDFKYVNPADDPRIKK